MSDLVEFLKARLDEDERHALAVEDNSAPWRGRWVVHGEALKTYNGWTLIYKKAGDTTPFRPGLLAHIARHDPARVLREVEAKRQIVELHQEGVSNDLPPDEEPTAEGIFCMACTPVGEPPFYPCSTLRLLALPYDDHPDFQEEWRV